MTEANSTTDTKERVSSEAPTTKKNGYDHKQRPKRSPFTLYVSGFRSGTTAAELGKYFETNYGSILRVDVLPARKSTGLQYGFVTFEHKEDFETAFLVACSKELHCFYAIDAERGLIASKSKSRKAPPGEDVMSFYQGNEELVIKDKGDLIFEGSTLSIDSSSTLAHDKSISGYKRKLGNIIKEKKLLRARLKELEERDSILTRLISLERQLKNSTADKHHLYTDDELSDAEDVPSSRSESEDEDDDDEDDEEGYITEEPLPAPDGPPPRYAQSRNRKRRRHSPTLSIAAAASATATVTATAAAA